MFVSTAILRLVDKASFSTARFCVPGSIPVGAKFVVLTCTVATCLAIVAGELGTGIGKCVGEIRFGADTLT